MSLPIRDHGSHLRFLIGPKKAIGRERRDYASCEVLLNFVQQFREKVENVSANQRPGLQSWFSDQPENITLIEDIEILLPVKFRFCSTVAEKN